MSPLEKLHDATLSKVELSWATGELKFHIHAQIDGKDADIEIAVEGLTSLKIPRYHPWGPSVSINKAWQENSGEAVKLTIEMQSGDVIEARVKSYTVNPPSL
jgi:hypothetical protein